MEKRVDARVDARVARGGMRGGEINFSRAMGDARARARVRASAGEGSTARLEARAPTTEASTFRARSGVGTGWRTDGLTRRAFGARRMTPPAIARGRSSMDGARARGTEARVTAVSAPGGFPTLAFAPPPPGMVPMYAAFGPNVENLRKQAAMTKCATMMGKGGDVNGAPFASAMMYAAPFVPLAAFGVAPLPFGAAAAPVAPSRVMTKSPSASDGSHNTTHVDGDDADGEERSTHQEVHQEAHFSGRGLAVMRPHTSFNSVPLSLRNARLEALAAPDRSQTPGVKSPFSAANVLLNMMTRGSDDENEAPAPLAPKRGAHLQHPLSVPCPKKRRTAKNARARSNLSTFEVAPVVPPQEAPSHDNSAETCAGGSNKPKAHRPWSLPEVKALVRGVAHYGRGQWADIKALRLNGVSEALVHRSAVDLKDKWRNLLRVAMLPALYKRREINGVPSEILEQVRVLASSKMSDARGKSGTSSREASRSGTTVATVQLEASAPEEVKAEVDGGAGGKGVRRSKHHSPWTMEEAIALVEGVDRCGGCRWTVIKKTDDPALARRTAMDLKDKWRNLLQLASLPEHSRRKQETPQDFLQRVLDLEAQYGSARRKGRKSVSKLAA